MRKTYVLFGLALTLLIGALLVGLPRRSVTPPVVPAVPIPAPVVHTPTPTSQDTLQIGRLVRLDGGLSSGYVLAQQEGQLSLLMDLNAARIEAGARPTMAIALVIDRSGSMAGEKMRQAKRAAKALVERLADDDRISIVTYSSDYAIDLDLTRLKGQRARINRVIDEILDGGGTNLAGGLTAGIKALRRADPSLARRLILMSDGNANQGLTDPGAIADIGQKARQQGITVSTLGVGVDFNEDMMTLIAQAAGGGYYYARNGQAIAAAFDAELNGLMSLTARQVEVSLELAGGVRIEEVYGYRTERRGDRVVIPVGDMASGAHRRVMVRLDVSAAPAGVVPIGTVVLAYQDARGKQDAEHQGALRVSAITDVGKIGASQRSNVLEAFTTAEAAKERSEAVKTYARGDRKQAMDAVQRSIKRFKAKNVALKSPKVAAQVIAMESALNRLQAVSAESDDGKDLVKQEKLEAYEAFAY